MTRFLAELRPGLLVEAIIGWALIVQIVLIIALVVS